MTRIGDKKVVYHTTLLLADGVPAEFEFMLGTWNVKFRIVFDPEKKEGQDTISWAMIGDRVELVFHGLTNALGTASKSPVKIGAASNGENLGFLFFHHKAANMNRLDFSFLLGGAYE